MSSKAGRAPLRAGVGAGFPERCAAGGGLVILRPQLRCLRSSLGFCIESRVVPRQWAHRACAREDLITLRPSRAASLRERRSGLTCVALIGV